MLFETEEFSAAIPWVATQQNWQQGCAVLPYPGLNNTFMIKGYNPSYYAEAFNLKYLQEVLIFIDIDSMGL